MTGAGLLFLVALVAGLVVAANAATLVRHAARVAQEREGRTWPRQHVRSTPSALPFVAFDMEMAYIYP